MREKSIKLAGIIVLLFASNIAQAQSYVTDKVVVGVYEYPDSESNLIKALPTGTPLEVLEKNTDFSRIRTPDGFTGWIENGYVIEHKPAQLVVLELTDKQKQTERELEDARKEILDMQEKLANQQDRPGSATTAELDKLKKTNRRLRNQIGDMDKEMKKLQAALDADTATRQKLEQQLSAAAENADNSGTPSADSKDADGITPVNTSADKVINRLQTENAAMQQQLDAVYNALSMNPPSKTPVTDKGGISMHIGWLATWLIVILAIGLLVGWKWYDWVNVKRHGGFRL